MRKASSQNARPRYNIAHILPWTSVGGTEYGTLRLIQALSGDHFNNIAFYINGSTAIRDMFAAAGSKTVSYEGIKLSRYQPGAFLFSSLKLAREMRRMRIDLVHCSDLLACFYTGLAARLAGLPVVCHIRNRYQDISRRDQKMLHAVDHFIFVSHDTWKHFGYKISSRHGSVVYDGLEICDLNAREAKQDVQREFQIPDNVKIVGMVARIAPQKDYKTLIKAAKRVVAVDPNVRFLIVGDHSGTEEYRDHYREVRALLAADRVADYFIFTDFRTDVPRMISVMDIFVLSTHCEGLPLSIIEAMAQAKPVIATAVDGIPEIVLANKTGALYAHGNDAQLAERILSMLKDEERNSSLGRAAREFVQSRFSREQFAANMTNLYHQILGVKLDESDTSEALIIE